MIDEIDLPQIIRDSTSGIAGDAMNTVRRQGIGADRLVSRIGDKVVFRRHARKVDAPVQPGVDEDGEPPDEEPAP